MPAGLDIGALRSLVAIAEAGGFRRAAESLHLSQSGVSQHVRRLEKVVGRPLVAPDGRGVRFTSDGELLVAEARTILAAHDAALVRLGVHPEPGTASAPRTICVGTTEHAAEQLLPALTAALATGLPTTQVRFRLDRGWRLEEGLQQGTVDVAVLIGRGEESARPAGELALSWFAATGWVAPPTSEPVALVAIDEPCTLRRRALAALAQAGRAAVVVGESGHLSGVVHTVRAGAGVALLADIGAVPPGLEAVAGLPEVAAEPLHVRTRRGAPAGLARLVGDCVQAALS
jgi:DNA-binding transcriptional LysR family regulator